MLLGIIYEHFALFDKMRLGSIAPEVLPRQFALRRVNILIGKSGSGKSMALAGLKLISDIMREGIGKASGKAMPGGFGDLAANNGFSFVMLFQTAGQRLLYTLAFERDEFMRPHLQHEKLVLLPPLRAFALSEKEAYLNYQGAEPITDLDSVKGLREALGQKEGQERLDLDMQALLKATPPLLLMEFDQYTGRFYDMPDGKMREAELADRKFPALAVAGRFRKMGAISELYNEINHWYCPDLDKIGKSSPSREEGGHKHLNDKMSNIQNVLTYIKQKDPGRYNEFMQDLSQMIPEFNFKSRKKGFPDPKSLASGKLRLFSIRLMLEDPRPLICLDGADDTLYHESVEALGKAIREYSFKNKGNQIILSTQNPYFLDNFKPDEVWSLREGDDGHPEAVCAASDDLIVNMYEEGVGLGTVWYNGHMDD